MNQKYFLPYMFRTLCILPMLALQIFCSSSTQSEQTLSSTQTQASQSDKIKASIDVFQQALPIQDVQKIVLEYLAEPTQTWIPTHSISRTPSVGSDKIAFSADSNVIAFNDGNYVKLWQMRPDIKLLQKIPKKEIPETSATSTLASPIAFSVDRKYLAMLVNNNVTILQNVNNVYVCKKQLPNKEQILSLAFSPDSTILAAGFLDGSVSQWAIKDDSVEQLEPKKQNTAKKSGERCPHIAHLAFSPSGLYLAAANNHIVTIFGKEDFKNVISYVALQPLIDQNKVTDINPLNFIGFLPNNIFITVSASCLKIWQLQMSTFKLRRTFPVSKSGHVAFAPDNKTIAISSGNTIQVFNLENYKFRQLQIINTGEPAHAIAFSPDGNYFAASFNDHVQIYEYETQEHTLARVLGHTKTKKSDTAASIVVTEVD